MAAEDTPAKRPRKPRQPFLPKKLAAVRRKSVSYEKKKAVVESAKQELQAAVDEARDAGASWPEIAEATGMGSRQVAEIRFSTAGQKRNNRSKK
ncbi:MAG: hypothetical protein JO248_05270, partial [Acidimicrobiia bacterium]|nr:hypothetical protein [Acidimicrobiia bacterium]